MNHTANTKAIAALLTTVLIIASLGVPVGCTGPSPGPASTTVPVESPYERSSPSPEHSTYDVDGMMHNNDRSG